MSVKPEDNLSFSVCVSCLTTGRRLVYSEAVIREYASLMPDYSIQNMSSAVCWECASLLKRVSVFKAKAAQAQQWLIWFRSQQQELVPPETSLSSLKPCTKTTYDVEIDYDDVPADSGEYKEVSKVECEFDSYEDAASDGQAEECVVKAEPPDELFSDEPVEVKKRSKKLKAKKTKVKMKRDVATEAGELVKVKKRVKASPFDNYTITTIPPDEVERQRQAERLNAWYVKSPHKCETCIYGFRSSAQYDRHVQMNHSKKAGSYICHVCESRHPTKRHLEKHIRVHTEQYVCNICGATFNRIHTVRQHYTTRHKGRKCKYCSEEFFDVKSMMRHRRSAHVNFQCDKCGKKTSSKYTLKKHLRTHEPYPCAECDSVFSKKKNLDQHVRNRHATRASEAYCVECDRQFASRPSYLLHLTEKHSPAIRFRCPECDKPFNRKIYMKNHYNLMHLKKTNYYCKLCDKYICRKDGLRKHIEFVHEGKRLPKNKMCDICGRGFSTNKTLIHHLRTHTGERPHQCEFCTAAFAQATALKTHVKHIHLQLKRTTHA